MRHYQYFFAIIIVLFSSLGIANSNLYGQIFVSPANSGNKNQDAVGFYYALPRNAIKVDVIIEKNERFKGPYSEFASKILGIDDFVKQDETSFKIIDILTTTVTEPDPDAWFFVEFDERGSKDARSLVFDLHSNGIILSFDDAQNSHGEIARKIDKTFVNAPNEKHFQYYAERNLYQRIDTIVRRITIDTTVIRRNILQSAWVDRNPEQKARAAADFIHKIRDSRLNLITGFQEINYGQSIVYMDQQLQNLEEEYLSLFLGKEVKTIIEQSVYFYPDKETKGIITLVKFSENVGLTNDGNGKGDPLQINIEPLMITASIIDENKTIGKSKLTNSLYYRIPDAADVSVIYKGKTYAKERFGFSQLGVLSTAPVNKTRLIFDPETGMIKTVKRE
ncbi:MAG: hypothetical protein CVT92_04960 [Bacteroidetes bacterium HGW-Bacteroidetes-1]|jgi:hypothetical protein|nr:MAG: hypothetical protein CVT92_04960 [Bacteroidetes bacterium HGW-Bacteroidetes-1]